MSEPVRFHFDPICPWCYQTSKWIRLLEADDVVAVTWAPYSLSVAHYAEERPIEDFNPDRGQGIKALRVAVLVEQTAGNEAVGAFYAKVGRRFFESDEPVDLADHAVLASCVEAVGVDVDLAERAIGDASVWQELLRRHAAAQKEGIFGVPWITRSEGRGFFGPVLSEPPTESAQAADLWSHVSWLADMPTFAELKLLRTAPTLPYYQRTFGTRV